MAYLVHQGDGETDAAFHFTVPTPLQRARRSKTAAYKTRPQRPNRKAKARKRNWPMDEGEKGGGLQIEPWGSKKSETRLRLPMCVCVCAKLTGMEMRPAGGAFGCVPKGVWVRDRSLCLVLERHRVAGRVAGRVR